MAGRKNPQTFERTYPADDGVTVTVQFAVNPADGTPDSGLVRVVRLTFEGDDLGARHLRAFPLGRALAEGQEQAWDAAPVLTSWPGHVPRPDGTDEWYRGFAALFRYAKATHPKSPAAFVAADFSVPVTTVHRWTRETRRRGYLPPDPRGKKSK